MADVVLVDPNDNPIGICEKLRAHTEGVLHRALSVFVLDATGTRMLLQQRAHGKYHSGGLWSNACCSHPAPGESVEQAAHRRLLEELGFDCALDFAFRFTYRAEVAPSLIEHELDHVFIARCDAEPRPNPDEIAAVKWVPVEEVLHDVELHPDRYSAWFSMALDQLRARGWLS